MKKTSEKYDDIGVNIELDIPRISHLMKLGILFALVCISADIILGYGSVSAGAYNLPSSVARYLDVSDIRIFLSAVIGVIGIPAECLCYFSIYRLIAAGSKKYAHLYRSGLIGCLIFGGTVHVSCCALAYFMKRAAVYDTENLFDETVNFSVYFVLPATVLFVIFFAVLIISEIKAVSKGLTVMPKKAWIFSPLFGVAAACLLKLPNFAFTNALASAWISIGNLWTFCGMLILIKKYGKSQRKA
ncbi:MAG: hypothetical protein NC120_14130 [Ruminococcus sp.]|nr:hypothetical protein [Ruminococcus sp.]